MTARSTGRPLTPDQRVRDLSKEFRSLEQEPPGAARAARLADFTRAAHLDRQLNMAMHTARLCLADDPDAPALLLAAYTQPEEEAESQLAALSDLCDLARYIDRSDVAEQAGAMLYEGALDWVSEATDGERRYRLRTVESLTGIEVADRIRDKVGET